jgi:UDP-glucuronate decarboxylase
MKVVITGGAGFIGAHLARRLVRAGHDVLVLDNLLTGSLENICDLLDHPHFRFLEHDVEEPYDTPADRIYHLACPASPPHSHKDPARATLTNVQGTYHALCLGERTGARVLIASTSEVHGDPVPAPQREDYHGNVSCTNSRACYDEGKRRAESLAMDFGRRRRTDVRIARIFNTYGPGMTVDDGCIVSNFIIQALTGRSMTVRGDGRQTRSLCYIDDMIDGLSGLMECEGLTGPIHLGNPVEMTVLAIADAVRRHVGRGRIVERPLLADDPRCRRPDIRLARRVLGFRPRIALEQGLPRTIRYFEGKLRQQGVWVRPRLQQVTPMPRRWDVPDREASPR